MCLLLPCACAPEVTTTLWQHNWFGDVPGPRGHFGRFTKGLSIFSGAYQHGPSLCGGSGAGGKLPRWAPHPTFKFEFNTVSLQEFWESVYNGSKHLNRSGRRRWYRLLFRRSTMRAGGTPNGHGFLRKTLPPTINPIKTSEPYIPKAVIT